LNNFFNRGGLQCLLNICDDCAAEHKITFNCNKTIGVSLCPNKYKQAAPLNVFLNGVCVQLSDQVKYLGGVWNASLKLSLFGENLEFQTQERNHNNCKNARAPKTEAYRSATLWLVDKLYIVNQVQIEALYTWERAVR